MKKTFIAIGLGILVTTHAILASEDDGLHGNKGLSQQQVKHLEIFADLYRRYVMSQDLPLQETNRLLLRAVSERKCIVKLYGPEAGQLTEKLLIQLRGDPDFAALEFHTDSKVLPNTANLADASISPFCSEYQL